MDYDNAIEQLVEWALKNAVVRGVILTGSGSTGETHPLSDRDAEIYTTDPASLLSDDSWWARLGEVLVVERLDMPGWYPSRLVYYVGGKLDLTVIPAAAISEVPRQRPFTVLLDKDNAAAHPEPDEVIGLHPSESDFDERLNWAYAAALMCAKAIARDEPWSSKIRDRDLKHSLLVMIEWDHRARYGLEFDVRFLGSGMRQWMDRGVQDALEKCWARFDSDDSERALLATVALFAALSTRVAVTLRFAPFDHERVSAEIAAVLSSR
ncbi:aminoglycoside 6-adenylyltransferase [Subtercola sp. RTI3]|uniref:aminoglycoside 6-adenylyltransferase n=1 Tax=Subtercola sp. RTI3 TaxID=3048639 RepID=UPI002B2283B2|nr:aminoglycoside 6-adenylyltransferase [Subtercola sp. RTI3]MEA9984675.1 aminoglycoside 6-adenylyltransferase [Subtercola sp. RTI3]